MLNLQDKGVLVKQINETLNQIKIVMVDSVLPLNFENSSIAPDNKAMGRELAREALYDAKEGETFGVITGSIYMQSNQERLEGIKEGLGERVAFIASEPEDVSLGLWKQTKRILCLDTQAGEMALESGKEEEKILYTIGRTEKLVYYLDRGVVDTMLLTDEFVEGYTALEILYRQLRYYAEIENEVVPYFLVNRDNLYTEEKERIMFPWVQ